MNCPSLSNTPYQVFGREIWDKALQQHIPLSGSLEVTSRCNLRCRHCYLQHNHKEMDPAPELSGDEIKYFIDQMAEAGSLWLLITGGEPLIRPDFIDLYQYAIKKGFLITLFTNGTTLNSGIVEILKKYPPLSIEISIYGATAETYEKVTGIPSSYEKCLAGIERLKKAGIPFNLKSVILTLNRHEIGEMQQLAEGMDVPFRFDTILNPCLNGDKMPLQYRLTPQEVVDLDLLDTKRRSAWQEYLSRSFNTYKPGPHLYQCGAGLTSFHINSDGHMNICIMSRQQSHDLRKGSFQQGWQKLIPQIRSKQRTKASSCQNCRLLPLCSQCPGMAWLENRDEETAVDYYCRIAHQRQQTFTDQGILKTGENIAG